jgi:prepilin-type N-terminal cleavage/methylation domain-containing protein
MIDRPRSTGPLLGNAGFTAVEMLIVAVVLLVFASMAYPQVASRITASHADNAARVVASDLRMAVALAHRQGTPLRVEFDEDDLELRLIDRSGTVVHQRGFGSGSEFPLESAEASAAVFVFPNRLASAQFLVQLATPARTSQVRMTRTTLITVEDP